jgi:UDP-2,3-diacylglucosamine hydrolase
MRDVHIVSDIHLGAIPQRTERAFEAYLDKAGEEAGALIIAGDLFDFWFEYGEVIPGRHFRVLAALNRLVEAGIPVTMVGGNHDYWGGRFLREEIGIDFHGAQARTEIAGREALIVHGDGVGSGDVAYRLLKAVLRSRAAIAGFRLIHPQLGMRIARGVSSTEGKVEQREHVLGRAAHIEEWALSRLAGEPTLGWLICGHAHLPTIARSGAGQYYLNAGDWLRNYTYITVSEAGEPAVRRWPDQAARP